MDLKGVPPPYTFASALCAVVPAVSVMCGFGDDEVLEFVFVAASPLSI